ncbi:MAG: hypothetical protein AB7E74_09030 [Pirellulales bacterium]
MSESCERDIDELAAALHSLGWTCGDLAFRHGDSVVWQFYGVRGEQRVVVRGHNQREVWAVAHDQAVRTTENSCYR